MEANIYINQHVAAIIKMHQEVLNNKHEYLIVNDFLKALTINLYQAYKKKEKVACIEISNYHPNYLGKRPKEIFEANLVMQDIWLCILHEFGYKDGNHLRLMDPINLNFELTVDALLKGNISELTNYINQNPDLINQTSTFGHNASLLHYASSNAVELWRQVVPANICEIVSFLIKKGADKSAKIMAYGGHFTPLEMAATSIHPLEAGVQKELIKLLS